MAGLTVTIHLDVLDPEAWEQLVRKGREIALDNDPNDSDRVARMGLPEAVQQFYWFTNLPDLVQIEDIEVTHDLECKHCHEALAWERFTQDPGRPEEGWIHATGNGGRVYCYYTDDSPKAEPAE